MKCDELKPYLVGYERQYYVYDATSVEEAIAELKAENERLKEGKNDYKQFYKDTFKEIESLKASHYAEMVDAGMRERRLRRALYKACANWAIFRACILEYFCIKINAKKWERMYHKCLAKAEEYK